MPNDTDRALSRLLGGAPGPTPPTAIVNSFTGLTNSENSANNLGTCAAVIPTPSVPAPVPGHTWGYSPSSTGNFWVKYVAVCRFTFPSAPTPADLNVIQQPWEGQTSGYIVDLSGIAIEATGNICGQMLTGPQSNAPCDSKWTQNVHTRIAFTAGFSYEARVTWGNYNNTVFLDTCFANFTNPPTLVAGETLLPAKQLPGTVTQTLITRAGGLPLRPSCAGGFLPVVSGAHTGYRLGWDGSGLQNIYWTFVDGDKWRVLRTFSLWDLDNSALIYTFPAGLEINTSLDGNSSTGTCWPSTTEFHGYLAANDIVYEPNQADPPTAPPWWGGNVVAINGTSL